MDTAESTSPSETRSTDMSSDVHAQEQAQVVYPSVIKQSFIITGLLLGIFLVSHPSYPLHTYLLPPLQLATMLFSSDLAF